MTRTSPDQHASSSIKTEASEWFTKLHAPACSEETRQEFAQWIKADPQHELAYEQCRTLWLIAGSLKYDPDLKHELEGARQRIEELRTGTFGKLKKSGGSLWQRTGKRMAQVAAVLLVGLVFVYTAGQKSPEEYITHVGEQRLVQLADGSTVMLNTNTKITVSYSHKKRRIDLINGEAYFDVSKDPQRPFEVVADNSLVRAVGTEFNVALLNHAVNVDVAEGIVEFETPETQSSATEVAAKLGVGEAVKYRQGDADVKIHNANLARVSAWQVRKIYFDANTLAEAVEEYNRYTQQKVTVVDADLNQQRITGIFHVGDVDAFIFSLEQGLNARVVRKDGAILVMKRYDSPQG